MFFRYFLGNSQTEGKQNRELFQRNYEKMTIILEIEQM